jgi:glycosyltransferase involved in cell wall biosynthesis
VKRLIYINNRYRHYDLRKYRVLSEEFHLQVIWIAPFPDSETPPLDLLERIHYSIVSRSETILKPWHLLRSLRLALLVGRAAASADLVLSTTSDSWKSKVVFAAARLRGAAVAFRKEKWIDDRLRLGALSRAYWTLDRRLTEFIERRADGLLVGGSKAREYLRKKGIPRESVLPFSYLHEDLAQYPVDTELRRGLQRGGEPAVTFLYLGRIMPQKGLESLVLAFNQLTDQGYDATLLIVGDAIREDSGRGRISIEYLHRCQGIAEPNPRVWFRGPVAPDKVNSCYLAADVFVHPHVREIEGRQMHEGWGNVISEAACMSKPIITTDRVASAFDLVTDGLNGFVLDSSRLEGELLGALRFFCEHRREIRAFGIESRKRYEAFINEEQSVRSLELVVRSASRNARKG